MVLKFGLIMIINLTPQNYLFFNSLHAGQVYMLLFSSADFFFKIYFLKKIFQKH